jgi:ankyrin repeat protein
VVIYATQLLVERGGDLNKRDATEHGLLVQPGIDINVFKFLVDNGCDIFNGLESGFMHALISNNPEYLRYLVQNNRISPDNLNRTFSTGFWCLVQCRECADLLLSMGLDINIRDRDDLTALGRLLLEEQEASPEIPAPYLRRAERIAILREKGARE